MTIARLNLSIFFCLIFSFGLNAQSSSPFFNVKDYGASGEKGEIATAAIQRAIDACHESGGGTVYFPGGDFTSGSIELKSFVTIHLSAGATLYASKDTADYTFFSTHQRRLILIYANSAQRIGIVGKGRIHGQAKRSYEPLKKVDNFIKEITEEAEKAGVEMKMYYKVDPIIRTVTFEKCQDITIEDISIIESSSWLLDIKWCDRIFIRGAYLESSLESGVNADGIDIDGCTDVVISDCIIITGDDAIALKANKTPEPQRNTENVTVTNCIVTSTSTGLKIGTETYGNFRHITFSNCVVRNSNRGLSIVVRDGATVENVIFSNITIETNRKHFNWWGNGDPIWLVLKQRYPGRSKMGVIRNVLFENIIAHGQGTSKVEGFSGTEKQPEPRRLENIQFRNVQLFMYPEEYKDKRATHGFEAHHVDGLTLENLEISWTTDRTEPKWQNGAYIHEVNELRIDGFIGRHGLLNKNDPTIHLKNIQNALLQQIEAKKGAKTLVYLSGNKTESIVFKDLDLMNQASKDVDFSEEVPRSSLSAK